MHANEEGACGNGKKKRADEIRPEVDDEDRLEGEKEAFVCCAREGCQSQCLPN